MFADDLPQADAGSECGFDLLLLVWRRTIELLFAEGTGSGGVKRAAGFLRRIVSVLR